MHKKRDIKTLVFSRSFDTLELAVDYATAIQRFSVYDYAIYPIETKHGPLVYHVYLIKPFRSCRS